MTSYHPTDVAEGYCSNCGDWTSAPHLTMKPGEPRDNHPEFDRFRQRALQDPEVREAYERAQTRSALYADLLQIGWSCMRPGYFTEDDAAFMGDKLYERGWRRLTPEQIEALESVRRGMDHLENAVKDFPQTEEDARTCVHGNRVWFGHECGKCEIAGGYRWRSQ